MKPLKINIVLPFFTTRPGGGMKIMYEYANRLADRGHYITILHSIKRPYTKIKSPVWWKQLQLKLRGLSKPGWFSFHSSIQSLIVREISDKYVPDADITLCTWWEMAYMITKLSASKGKRFNLIQDHETWKGYEDEVHKSYGLPVQNLVIAKHLQKLVENFKGGIPIHIPNAIDTYKFALKMPIEERNPLSVIMLYSEEKRKGTLYGIEALSNVKKRIPGLEVTLFGVYDKPQLPEWINYYEKPKALEDLMNKNAIFLTPSLGEGWALPPAEAMACGCAVICTNIGGHADYAIDNETALLVSVKNINDIIDKLVLLLQDQGLRMKIAAQGNRFITERFSWEASVNKMENCFYDALK